MKLTKQKLEQLIMEEMRHFRPAPYDPRADKEHPQYADKLSNLAASGHEGYQQAIDLSDALDGEPIDISAPKPGFLNNWFMQGPVMGRSKEYKNMMRDPWNAAKGKFYIWAQTQPHFQKRNAPGVRSIFHLPKPQRYEELKNFLRDTGDQESYDVMKRTLERAHMSTYLNYDQAKHSNHSFDLYESTGEQKKQQRRDAYTSQQKQRRKMKARIKRSQNKGEAPYKSERPDFDPIKDLGKAMKKQYKDLEVRANGEEINESLSNFNPSHVEKLAKMFVSGDLEAIRQAVELSNGIGLETQIREESAPMGGGGTIFLLKIEFSNLEFIEIIKKLHTDTFLNGDSMNPLNFNLGGPGSMTIEKIIR